MNLSKQIIFTLAAITLLFGSGASAQEISIKADARLSASSTASTSVKAGIKADIQHRVQEQKNIRNEMTDKRAELRNEQVIKRDEKRQDHISRRTLKAADQLTQHIDRLIEIKTRLVTHLEKFKARGADVSASESILATFDLKVNQAKSEIASFKAIGSVEASTTASSTEPSKILKDLFKDAQDSVKAAHQVLVDATKALKPGQNAVRATTTIQITQ